MFLSGASRHTFESNANCMNIVPILGIVSIGSSSSGTAEPRPFRNHLMLSCPISRVPGKHSKIILPRGNGGYSECTKSHIRKALDWLTFSKPARIYGISNLKKILQNKPNCIINAHEHFSDMSIGHFCVLVGQYELGLTA